MVAGPVGGLIAVGAGYRIAFAVAAILGAGAAVLAGTLLRRPVQALAPPVPDATKVR